jgi:dTDP-4-dehydrorhamnose 3,5-epimerase
LKVEKTELEGVLLIKLESFEDFRGEYLETYNEKSYQEKGITIKFVQDDISVSTHHVLRGIHGDAETWKLISCLYGKFYFVVVNCDTENENFGKWQAFTLSEKNRFQVLVPPKHGNAHLVLSDRTIFHYKQSTDYNPLGQFTYKWNEPRFNIWWPVRFPILSRRDEYGQFVT